MIDLLYTISMLCCCVDKLTAKQSHAYRHKAQIKRKWHIAKRETNSLTNNKRVKGLQFEGWGNLGEILGSIKSVGGTCGRPTLLKS